ncbi:MAG: SpoIID/LytB domain-containing protein [Ignavibacteriales bacterium]
MGSLAEGIGKDRIQGRLRNRRGRGSGAICAVITALFVVAAVVPCAGAAPVQTPVVRVLLATAQPVVARVPAGATISDERGAIIASPEGATEISFRLLGDGVSVSLAGREFTADQIEVRPGRDGDSAWFRLGESRYRGVLRVMRSRDGGILAVNALPLEEYLYGVVGCEIPPGWPEEALKSQAVAARSFAMSCRAGALAAGLPYDLGATADGQIYGGLDREDPRTSRAVDATRGVVLTYAGEPVRAVFHSSSGGHTENSEFVWSTPFPYLKGVEDSADESPHRSWEFRATAGEIQEMLGAAGFDLGKLLEVRGLEAGVSGRWSTVLVRGSKREAVLRGADLRRALGLKSTWFTVTEEGSRWEEVMTGLDVGQAWAVSAGGAVRTVPGGAIAPGSVAVGYRLSPGGYVFRGRGYGHGVGLSQWGARTLANRGYKYPDILQHYYLNTRLDNACEP